MKTWGRDIYVRFEGFTAVTMNNGVFWDVTTDVSFLTRATRSNIPEDAILNRYIVPCDSDIGGSLKCVLRFKLQVPSIPGRVSLQTFEMWITEPI
jgi:hypothetical protein